MLTVDYPIHTKTLANGLRVVVSPDHTVPVATLNIWVGVGSRHEVTGRTGFAHLFEHLMFQGSEHVAAGEHFAALLAQGGRLNATTWFDRTNYFETVPTGALELAMWLEADRHGALLAAVTQENLDNQRDVVKEEKRQRYDNVPYGNAMIDVYATVFPPDHPYHHPTIGSMADLDAATLVDVHAFYREHYGPDNSVVTVVGDIDPERAFGLVETYFGSFTRLGRSRREALPQLPPLAEPARLVRHEDVPNDRLHIAFRLPTDNTDAFHASALALDVVAALSISRLTRRLVRTEQVVTSLSAHAMGFVDGVSLGFLSIDVAVGEDPDRVEAAVCEELDRLAADGPTPVEMEAAFAETQRSWLSALASQEERADLISHYTLLADDPQYINGYLGRIAAVTAGQVRDAAATWLNPKSRAVVAYRRAGAAPPDSVPTEQSAEPAAEPSAGRSAERSAERSADVEEGTS